MMTLCKYILCLCGIILIAACSTIHVDSIAPDLSIANDSRITPDNRVNFEPFEIVCKDQKENIIGEARVGAFNTSTDYESSEKVSSIIEISVKKGFSQAGFKIVEPSAADFIVNGLVDKFWASEQAAGSKEYSKASVRYDLIIRNRKGAVIWANSMEVFKYSEKTMLDTTDNNIPTLTLALKESVEGIFKDKYFWDAVSEGK